MERGRQYWCDKLGTSWALQLKPLLITPAMNQLMDTIAMEYAMNQVYPLEQSEIFKAFKLCSWDNLQIVIIGEEPHKLSGSGPLAFASPLGAHMNSCSIQIRNCVEKYNVALTWDFDTTLEPWAKQGILMLNRSLTVRQKEPKSHKELWKQFFGSVLYNICAYKPETIFVLWGTEAQKYAPLLVDAHHVFSWEHPMKANAQYRDWQCPNFLQIDQLRYSLKLKKILW